MEDNDILKCPYCGCKQYTHEPDDCTSYVCEIECESCGRRFRYAVIVKRLYESFEEEQESVIDMEIENKPNFILEQLWKEMNLPCYWHDDISCKDRQCETCKHQPNADDKRNGKCEPRFIEWQEDYGGVIPCCPACGEMPHSLGRCFFCGQKLIKDERAIEWSKPQKIEYMDCFVCGEKNTMEFVRSRYNGHKHGHCTACGARFME